MGLFHAEAGDSALAPFLRRHLPTDWVAADPFHLPHGVLERAAVTSHGYAHRDNRRRDVVKWPRECVLKPADDITVLPENSLFVVDEIAIPHECMAVLEARGFIGPRFDHCSLLPMDVSKCSLLSDSDPVV